MTTLFISHSSKDNQWASQIRGALREDYQSLFLDFHPDDGIVAGADWERELYQKLRQSRGLVVLCTSNWLASPWCVAEAMIARERGRKVFMLATAEVTGQATDGQGSSERPRIPGFLKDTQLISLANLTMDEAYERLRRGLKEQLRPQDSFPLPERPYPGLKPFDEADAAVFFGRDHEIERVESALTRRWRGNAEGFILVLGASGCGKSSLVRAGVVPKLKRASDELGSGGQWVLPPAIMAGAGLEGLVLSLSAAFKVAQHPVEVADLRQRLAPARDMDGETGPAVRSLCEIASELLDANNRPEGDVLLVLDQLEEVFGTPDPSDARALLRLLLEASAAGQGKPPVVLATMRSDFMNAFQSFPGANDRYKEIPLDPMPRTRFGEVIEGPAERFGLRRQPGLNDRLVEDTRYDDALPLLAVALEKLYDVGHADGILEIKEYEALFPEVSILQPDGTTVTYRGVSAAIKHEADRALEDAGYDRLPDGDPRMRDLRKAFFSLARVGEQGQFTRRVSLRSEMPDSCNEVLSCFERRRLLVAGLEEGAPTLKVAHEALFRSWDRLQAWLENDRKALMLRAQIEDAAAEWEAESRAESRAWPEERILDAVREIDRSGVSLDEPGHPEIRGFLGPTAAEELERLPGLMEAEDAKAGSGRYGDAWRLPLSHEARASVGVRLAILGDRRHGVGSREDGLPDIAWHGIDGGEATIEIRSDPNNPNSEVVDTRGSSVAAFAMARYPITVEQFQTFLQDCHQDGRWRLPPGFPVDLPADYPPPKHRARHGNHPADSVNWYDAMAFCHWLSTRLDGEIRLPTEFEWQHAATGGDPANTFPWGPDWDSAHEPWRANTLESDLNRATAVGVYPLGASKAGVLDLAGTIYEWCLNDFEDPNDTEFPQERARPRVVRGGSWFDGQGGARCAGRYRYFPYDRDFGVGFRVVCSSPITNR